MFKLDRSKDFGVISGAEDGKAFEQNGKYFDSDGNEIGGKKAEKPALEGQKDAKSDAEKQAEKQANA